MTENISFMIIKDNDGYKVIAAYKFQEFKWIGFPTLEKAGERILEACRNLQKQSLNKDLVWDGAKSDNTR